jgi:plasmid stability protein
MPQAHEAHDPAATRKRSSETDIDEILIARLLEEQAPRLVDLRAVKVRDG